MTIGEVIEYNREKIGMDREYFASKLGVSVKTVYRWETGRRDLKMDQIRNIASQLNVSFQEFIMATLNSTQLSPKKRKGTTRNTRTEMEEYHGST